MRRSLSEYRVVLEEMDGLATVPRRGGDTGVATSRLLRVPAGAWDPLRLDDAVVPVTEKPLSEADRRSYAQFPLGACVGWHEDGVCTVGQIRANFPRRLLFRLAVFRLNRDVWQRVYLDSRGSEVPTVTTQESLIEVPYSAVIGKVVLDDAGYADKPSERRMVALRLRPQVWEVSPGSALGEAPDVEAIAVGVEVRRSTAEWPTVPAILVLGAEMTILPKGLTAEEPARVAADEIVFTVPDRDGQRYAEVVAAETWKMAQANPHLDDAGRRLLVWVCTRFRRSIWVDGAAYTRLKGAVYDIDVQDATPVAQQPYRKSPMEVENCEWHLQKAMALGILRPYVGSWATPAFVVKQKGKPRGRLVCDYRRVNAVTKRMYHPMPRVDTTLRAAAGARWYSGLDAVSGFNHLNLSDRAKEVLAICVGSGLYAWESLPFGPAD